MAYIDDFRALAGIAISKDVSQVTKEKAEDLLVKLMNTIEMNMQAENYQLSTFLNQLAQKEAKIEVIKQ